ncbi:MAG: peptidyl-prolyl cis-trans isomerase [Deltaproteobacteria bacterium]|nr:peptidyl-prolyl cis-trans isomerase [Deltaproteobacteria bacterium]
MKRKKWLNLFVLAGLFALLAGCPGGKSKDSKKTKVSKGGSEIVAKVGEIEISLEEFEKHINQQNRLVRTRYKSLEQKKKLLESMVEREAMVLEAKRLKLDQDPEVVRGLKKILARHLVNQEFNQKRAKQINISDDEIKKYYEENSDRYHSPAKVRVHKIVFLAPKTDSKLREEAKKKARDVLAKLKANPQDRRLFIQLAREKSEDLAAKRIGGDTNFKTKTQMEAEYGKVFAEAAFALKQTNEISEIIDDDKGFYIIRQSGKQPPIDLALEKVKEQIRTTLFARARGETYKAFVEDMKKKAGVSIYADVVEKAKVDLSDMPKFPRRDKPGHMVKGKNPGPLKGPIKRPGVKTGIVPPKAKIKIQPPAPKPSK